MLFSRSSFILISILVRRFKLHSTSQFILFHSPPTSQVTIIITCPLNIRFHGIFSTLVSQPEHDRWIKKERFADLECGQLRWSHRTVEYKLAMRSCRILRKFARSMSELKWTMTPRLQRLTPGSPCAWTVHLGAAFANPDIIAAGVLLTAYLVVWLGVFAEVAREFV